MKKVVLTFFIAAGIPLLVAGGMFLGETFAQLPMGSISVDARDSNGSPYPNSFTVGFVNPFGGAGSVSASHGQSMAVPAGAYTITSISPNAVSYISPIYVSDGGSATLSVVFWAPQPAQPPTCSSCSFNPAVVTRGGSTVYSWNFSGSPSAVTRYEFNCTGDIGTGYNGNNPPTQGSMDFRPQQSQTCVLRLWNGIGQSTDIERSIAVNPLPAPVVPRPQQRTFRAEIVNIASSHVSGSSRALLTILGPGGAPFTSHEFTIAALPGPASVPVEYQIPPITPVAEAQTYTARLCVDTGNEIAESDEANNCAETNFAIPSAADAGDTAGCPVGQTCPPQSCAPVVGECSALCGGGTSVTIVCPGGNAVRRDCNLQACPAVPSGTGSQGTPRSETPGPTTPGGQIPGPTGPGTDSGQTLTPPGGGDDGGGAPAGGAPGGPRGIIPRIWEVLPRF